MSEIKNNVSSKISPRNRHIKRTISDIINEPERIREIAIKDAIKIYKHCYKHVGWVKCQHARYVRCLNESTLRYEEPPCPKKISFACFWHWVIVKDYIGLYDFEN